MAGAVRIRASLEAFGLGSARVVPAYLVMLLGALAAAWGFSRGQIAGPPSNAKAWDWVCLTGEVGRSGFYEVVEGSSIGEILNKAGVGDRVRGVSRPSCWSALPARGPAWWHYTVDSRGAAERLVVSRLPERYCYLLGLPVDVNRAGVRELMLVPGIGETTARRIEAFRRDHGPFLRIEDLQSVKGIGPKTLEKLSGRLFVAPPEASSSSITCPP